MEYRRCNACGSVGQDGFEFAEVLEEAVTELFWEDPGTPEDLEEALSEAGRMACAQCGSVDTEEL